MPPETHSTNRLTSDAIAERCRRPARYLAVAGIVTLVVLVTLALSTWDSNNRFTAFAEQAMRIEHLRGRIVHLDEVLTMSARMTASTGDLAWEERYLAAVPGLDAAISDARELAPGLGGTVQTDAANLRLIELEEEAFALVRRGDEAGARTVLQGAEYAEQKALYARGMSDLDQALAGMIETKRRGQQRRTTALLIAAGIAIPLLVIGWIMVLRFLQEWRRRLLHELEKREELERTVSDSTQEVASAAAEIAASARQQEGTVETFRGSTAAAVVAVREIAATVDSLTHTMKSINELASCSAERATAGQRTLGDLGDVMQGMGDATSNLHAKIEAIEAAAGNINLATRAMVKVVDQTDLLSVNAAIEAETAGEEIGGFRVVSREIRRLADQTAEATLEIEGVVIGIQSSVTGGVQEVERFAEHVGRNVDVVRQVAGELGGIITDVGDLSARFARINEAMREHATGTEQISDSLRQLDDGAAQFAASSTEFARVTGQLHDVVATLSNQVSSFGGDEQS